MSPTPKLSVPELSDIHLHFLGIGGIGMSGIARIFKAQGYTVSGCDLNESETISDLRKSGIQVEIGHHEKHIRCAVPKVTVLVRSTAVAENCEEIEFAKCSNIPVIARAEALAEIMRVKRGFAVAGTHGKTSTTSLLGVVLKELNLDPTIVVGGLVDVLGGNARVGRSDWVVVEADESDGSFHHLPATYGILTNVDFDHMDYFKDLETLDQAFVDFVNQIPFYGFTVACIDDMGVARCLPRFTKPIVTYGKHANADYQLIAAEVTIKGSEFRVKNRDGSEHEYFIKKPGRHIVLNALAVIALLTELKLSPSEIRRGLLAFEGVRRRFETLLNQPGLRVIEDYAHHPTEIKVTLDTIREIYPSAYVQVVFQPHRYTRTMDCFSQFYRSFDGADEIVLTPVYSAGEELKQGKSSDELLASLIEEESGSGRNRKFRLISRGSDLALDIQSSVEKITVFLGAGDISKEAKLVTSRFNR